MMFHHFISCFTHFDRSEREQEGEESGIVANNLNDRQVTTVIKAAVINNITRATLGKRVGYHRDGAII